MSVASKAAPPVDPEVLALELANQKAQFEQLSTEWNELFRATTAARHAYEASPLYTAWKALDAEMAQSAIDGRACGQRVEALERQLHGRAVPDYGPDGVVV